MRILKNRRVNIQIFYIIIYIIIYHENINGLRLKRGVQASGTAW